MTVRERFSTVQSDGTADLYAEKTSIPKPLYVIIFSPSASKETVHWVIDLLERSQHVGGAELLVKATDVPDTGIILEISANPLRLLEAAEMMDIVKEDKHGQIREFTFASMDLFLIPGVDVNNLLSTSEKQRLILNEIMSLHSMDKKLLTGYPNIKLYPGQSIVQVCKDYGIISQIFPLHEQKDIDSLEKRWYGFPFTPQPLNEIRCYFGEAVGFYFAFLSFYTWALLLPSIIGILQTVLSFDVTHSRVFFAIVKTVWLTLFLECWKRRSNELAFTWGTLTTVVVPKLHPTFRGNAMEIDPVTKQHVPVYPGYKRHFRVYCVTTPIVLLCVAFALIVMFVYFDVESNVMEIYRDEYDMIGWILMQLPGVVYAVLVFVMSCVYRNFATFLTEWENHKTQVSFENHRVFKLLVFEFVNNFGAMFYIAFYMQDMELLKWQIGIMLIVFQLINHFQEAILPLLYQKVWKFWKKRNAKSGTDARIQRILDESEMWPYEGTYDDYLEIFLQFGYVFLFSSVYPLAAAFALINNVLEITADGFKLCRAFQRPQARPVKGIGIWQKAFEMLGVLAVMTNCALISMSPLVHSVAPDMSLAMWILVAVAIEHIVIGVKILLAYLISDVPKWVTVAIRKGQFESLQALKVERKLRTQELLKKMKQQNVEKED